MDEVLLGRTALHMACQNGHVDVVKCLLEHGADLEEEVYVHTWTSTVYT